MVKLVCNFLLLGFVFGGCSGCSAAQLLRLVECSILLNCSGSWGARFCSSAQSRGVLGLLNCSGSWGARVARLLNCSGSWSDRMVQLLNCSGSWSARIASLLRHTDCSSAQAHGLLNCSGSWSARIAQLLDCSGSWSARMACFGGILVRKIIVHEDCQ